MLFQRRYVGFLSVLGFILGTLLGTFLVSLADAHAPVQLNTVSSVLNSDNQFRYWYANATMRTDSSIHGTSGVEDFADFKLPPARTNFTVAERSLRIGFMLLNEIDGANKDYGPNNKICCSGAGSHNHTMFNYTFPQDVPLTHVSVRLFVSTSQGTGEINITTTFHSDGGAEQAFNNTRMPCTGGSFSKVYPRDRLVTRRVQIFYDDTTCQTPGSTVYANGFSAWSADNKADALNGVSAQLEYLDWLVNRTAFRNTRLGNDFGIIFDQPIIPQGKSTMYIAGSTCGLVGTSLHPWFFDAWIFIGVPSTVKISFLGFAETEQEVMMGAFAFDNSGTPFATDIRGSGGSNSSPCAGVPWFSSENGVDVGLIYTNTEILGGGNWSAVGGSPRGIGCDACIDSGVPARQYAALLYHDSRSPINTISQDRAFNEEATGNFDITNVTLVSLGLRVTRADNARFIAPLNSTVSYGNALYMVIAARNTTATPQLCNANVSMLSAGKLVPLAWTRSSNGKSWDGFFIRACGWLLRDIARQESLPIGFATSTVPRRDYRGIISAETWPQAAVDADAGTGYEIFTITSFAGGGGQGRHSDTLQCAASAHDSVARPICFGNIDTGDQIGAEVGETKWRFNVSDASQSSKSPVKDAPDVRIQDAISGNSNITNATGHANISSLSNIVRWSFTKNSYRTEYSNFTNVPLTLPINFSVHITADFTKHASISCAFNVAQSQYDCELRQFNTSAEALEHRGICSDALDIRTNRCVSTPGGPSEARILILDCSRDVTGDNYIFATNNKTFSAWSITDSTGVSGTVRVPRLRDDGAKVCDEAKAIELRGAVLFGVIQSGTFTVTLTTPEYRTIKFSLDGIAQGTIIITPYLTACKRGVVSVCREFESTDKVEITFSNTSRNSELLGGDFTRFTLISVRDVSFVKARPGIASNIIGTGAILGAEADAASRALFGIIIMIFILVMFGAAYYKVTRDRKSGKGQMPPTAFSVPVGFMSFFFVGMLGLWPEWLMIALTFIALGIGAIAAIGFVNNRRGGNGE